VLDTALTEVLRLTQLPDLWADNHPNTILHSEHVQTSTSLSAIYVSHELMNPEIVPHLGWNGAHALHGPLSSGTEM